MGDQWLHEMAQRVIDNTGEWLTPTWIIAADLLRSCGGDPDDTASELVGLLIDEIERLRQLCLASEHLLRGAESIYDPRGDTGPTHWLQTRDKLLRELEAARAAGGE